MKNKIKIALIRGSFLNPNELVNYGPLRSTFALKSFSSQKPLGINPHIPNQKLYSPFDSSSSLPAPWNEWGIRLTKIIANRTWGDPQRLFGLEKSLENFEILDVADPYYYFSYQAAKFRQSHPKTRLVVTFCETIPFNNEGTQPKKRIKKFVLQIADRIICHTTLSLKAAVKEGVERKKISILPLGVDLEQFSPISKRPENILFVGRLVPEKGVLELYRAFRELSALHHKLRLNFVGTGPLKNVIQKLAQNDKIGERVSITALPYEKIARAYRENTYFVLPSSKTATWEEQYGMVLIEAMASGMAIIGSKCGAISEVMGKAGVLVPPHNHRSLKTALEKLISNPTLRSKLSTRARARAKSHYSHTLFADRIKAVYEKLNYRHPRP